MANNDKSTLSPQQTATLINWAIRDMLRSTAEQEHRLSGEVRRELTEDVLHGYPAELCAKLKDSIASQSASGNGGNCGNATMFETHRDAIEDLFTGRNKVSNKNIDIDKYYILIIQRLALIDLFYSTNVNGKRQFGISEIADAIINYKTDTDLAQQAIAFVKDLAQRAIAFVKDPTATDKFLTDFINKKYGYDIAGKQSSATSLISKYLFFLVNAHGDKVGFPIYDSVVRDLLPALADKLGLNQGNSNPDLKEMTDYTIAVKNIISALSQNDSDLWNTFGNATHIKSQCDLLDYFLWRIGKAGNLSFSLLVTRPELGTLTNAGVLTQIKSTQDKIKKAKDKLAKAKKRKKPVEVEVENTAKQEITILTYPELFDKLPQRLTIWHILYLTLKK